MRKTLLIAAAALASSVISSQAQVYSQNIVGYVNIVETANVLSLEAPPLDLDGTGTNNTIASIYPNPATGDVVYAFNGVGYDTLTYKVNFNIGTRANPTNVTGWFNGSTPAASYSINPGQSIFYAPTATETNTFVGMVLQGTLTNKNNGYAASGYFGAGNYYLTSSQIPLAGGLDSVLGYVPGVGDVIYTYSSGGYDTWTYKNYAVGTRQNPTNYLGWSDGAVYAEPQISVGQGFWLNPAGGTTWVEVFTNN